MVSAYAQLATMLKLNADVWIFTAGFTLLLFYYYHIYFALHCMVKVFLNRLHIKRVVKG